MVSIIAGGRRYSFYIEGGSNLFTGCITDGGRHQFVSGSKSAGPNVYHDCHATNSWNDIGPHHRWGTVKHPQSAIRCIVSRTDRAF